MSPSSARNVDRITELQNSLTSLSKVALENEDERKKLLAVLRAQVAVLETPLEVVWRMMMEPHQSTALRSAQGMGLIEPIVSSSPRTATELATITKCDKQLIVRILRCLSAMKMVDEVDYETYASNPTTQILTVPSVGGGFKFMFDEAAVSVVHVPAFLSKTGYKNPEGPETCFQSAFNTDLQLFPYLMANPERMGHLNDLMTGQRMNRTEWFDFSDVDSILFDGMDTKDSDATLLIDIGGGRGHDLEAFRNKFPNAKGKLVLQDLPPVIADIEALDSSIVRMEHNFFTEQPIKGARAYYIRSCLHDYNDADDRKILRQIVDAMKPGYSKLLIFEWILPDVGTPLYPALLDLNMLALFSGMERTETHWRNLLESVGLEVVKVWSIGKETEGLIEAMKKA
ncbi:S-adenosyl-L-methionine-dependent methyltransferase [Mollisia scopiformis]|uniref:S-adenosyl-L-methionine-dependent methyltransferase n=1 Tax=Mollisia scopiformis TaxID=149040 RepID=A0A194X6R3_MOLSC|nr:S-adenosyl-L-methionine-dependent methyltransferase [Mollisia scopiformis]KUJ15863.1 S-adenosyl-L-methionine-dependent methyltransferase [Mollisia scopiformis]